MTDLSFQPLSSAVNVGFWHELTKKKLDVFKLSDSAVEVRGSYCAGSTEGLPARVLLEGDAFDGERYEPPPRHCGIRGTLLNFNTIEQFREADKKELFSGVVAKIWADVTSGEALQQPERLNRFLLLTFADLKKYKYYYWFAFPALLFDSVKVKTTSIEKITKNFNESEISSIRNQFSSNNHKNAYFLYRKQNDGENVEIENDLTKWQTFFETEKEFGVGFVDPCTLPNNPGWLLRNLLVLVAKTMNKDSINVLCYREKFHGGVQDISASLVLQLTNLGAAIIEDASAGKIPKASGWEKNLKGKLLPRMIDLADSMDPKRLAATAVDLNLKLMRWRLLPSVELEKLRETKCLLVGAGTLGCNVARQLLAWGVRHITLIDSGKVSFSNPVRQTLFEYADSLNGGKHKATAAAAQLEKIFPDVTAKGVVMSIPMPGHAIPPGQRDAVAKDVDNLLQLIKSHDVVYLLLDSREGRWLPTLLCAAEKKLCITTALGFDTFVVMRHGIIDSKDDANNDNNLDDKSKQTLGCYFCNDVVAPRNSLADRTLDQQCTVTRPAVSMMAGALATELMVGVLHHPLGASAPADNAQEVSEPTKSELGLLPHQIRGFLSHYSNMILTGHAYDRCTACSPRILRAWHSEGFKLIEKVMNEPDYAEEVSGLKELAAQNEEIDWDLGTEEDWDLDDF